MALTIQNLLSEAMQSSKLLTARYVAGFTNETAVAQAPHLPNHVAWSLGHLALTMHRVAEKLDGQPIPAGEIAPGAGDRRAFAMESIAFGSSPKADTLAYPPLERCVEIYNAACDRLALAARGASDAKLSESVPWGGVTMPLYLLVVRMMFHNGMHTGQIADLRRALGFKSIFA